MSKPRSCGSFLGCLVLAVCLSKSNPCFVRPGFLHLDYPDVADFEIGSEIRINCRLLNNTYTDNQESWHIRVDSSNLRFRLHGKSLNEDSELVEKVDNNTIAFVKKNATVEDSSSVICYGEGPDDKNETISYAGCVTSIYVGVPPQPVSDFKCTSHSFVNMTCTWRNPENKVRTKYTIEISYGVTRTFGASWKPCPEEHTGVDSCSWSASTTPTYDKMAEEFFYRINGTNSLGSKTWDFKLKHGSIVKLSPVKNLLLDQFSPREVRVTWEAPDETKHGGWKERLSIEYKVGINRLNSSDNRTILTTDKVLYLKDLIPNNKYQFLVRARTSPSVRFDLDSDPVSTMLAMPKARPDKPPSLLPSAFKYKLFNSVRTVTLLFSEIPPTNWNDDHLEYIVQVCSRSDQMCFNKTVEHTNIELEDLSVSKLYFVDVWSANSLGPSSTSSGIVIHPQSELLAPPANVEDELGYRMATLRWRTPPTLAKLQSLNADVFWCESYDKRRCQGEIFTKQVKNNDSFRIEVNDTRDYIYGVALSAPDGRTSGSVWSVCEINAGAHVGQVRELEALPDTDTTLKLKWKTGCGYQRKYVAGYQVEYCRMEHHANDVLSYSEECQHERPSNATASCHLLNFTVPTEEDFYVLEGLQTGEVYRVVLRAIDSVTSKFAPDSAAVCTKALARGVSVFSLIMIAIGSALAFTMVILVVTLIAKHMEWELHSTKLNAVRLPTWIDEIEKHNKRETEMDVIGSNGIRPEVDVHMTSTFNTGSHSGLDKLIPTSALESLMRDSGESPNLKGEPQNVLNMERPSANVATAPTTLPPAVIPQPTANGGTNYPASSMPPYTQLGLSATQFSAAPEQPQNTGYSQLSVVPTDPPAAEIDYRLGGGDENFDEYDEDRAPSPEPERLPRLRPNPGYAACNVMSNNTPKTSATSNGYVPAVRTTQ